MLTSSTKYEILVLVEQGNTEATGKHFHINNKVLTSSTEYEIMKLVERGERRYWKRIPTAPIQRTVDKFNTE